MTVRLPSRLPKKEKSKSLYVLELYVVDDESEQLALVQRLSRRDDIHVHGLVCPGASGRVDAYRHLAVGVHEVAVRAASVY